MRAFRNTVTALGLALLSAVSSLAGSAAQTASDQAIAGGNAMFPLTVGNSWSYRCSAEGSAAFVKTVKLTRSLLHDGKPFFQAEMRIRKDPKPLVYFLSTDQQGQVFSVMQVADNGREVLINAAPKAGDKLGNRSVAAGEMMHVPALGRAKVPVVRAENFFRDDPNVSSEQRMEWSGRYYAAGVGLVIEADGLGGQCVLTDHKLVKKLP